MNKRTRNPIIKKKIKDPVRIDNLVTLLEKEPIGFLLDSADPHHPESGLSYFGIRPYVKFRSSGASSQTIAGDMASSETGNPITLFKKFLDGETASLFPVNYPLKKGTIPTFDGGAVGYFSYDLGRFIEVIPDTAEVGHDLPEIYFAFYNPIISLDERTNESWIIYNKNKPSVISPKELLKLVEEEARISDAPEDPQTNGDAHTPVAHTGREYHRDLPHSDALNSLVSNFNNETYIEAVKKAKNYIRKGDIYQVNLSQRLKIRSLAGEASLYMSLRKNNPAPFGAYLKFPEFQIMSSSPERYMRFDGKTIETKPIKGTIARGLDEIGDSNNRTRLTTSAKDQAEHIMIVDLERNDLGRISKVGTVKVDELMKVESFEVVHHLVSTVSGEPHPGLSITDVLLATFPGGSITGAPKIRSMEIIEEIEGVKRDLYTGSIGYIGFDGRFDLNIAIRTLLKKDSDIYFSVGGGIVADSDPLSEYNETLLKAKALLKAIELA